MSDGLFIVGGIGLLPLHRARTNIAILHAIHPQMEFLDPVIGQLSQVLVYTHLMRTPVVRWIPVRKPHL